MTLLLHVGSKHISSWSLRPYMALAHTGEAFEVRTIKLDHDKTRAAIAKVTPTGRVPVLEHDGLTISDSLAICEYVAELFPAARLWPTDRSKRARARSICAEMHSGFLALRRDMPMDLCIDHSGEGHTTDALADVSRVSQIWHDAIDDSGGPFLFGTFTIADAMFTPVTTRFTTYDVPMDDVCRRYVAAVQTTAGFQRWLSEANTELADPTK